LSLVLCEEMCFITRKLGNFVVSVMVTAKAMSQAEANLIFKCLDAS